MGAGRGKEDVMLRLVRAVRRVIGCRSTTSCARPGLLDVGLIALMLAFLWWAFGVGSERGWQLRLKHCQGARDCAARMGGGR